MTALPDWDIVSDAELACAAAAGDRRAFASIYDRYADRLHDFCVGMLRDRDAAADCVQDVFCTAADRLSQLREADKLRPWLYAIARNECLRFIRARSRERVFDEVPEVESAEPGPDTMVARSELANLVAEAAGGLSDRDREVLELAYRHGLDGPDLAEALGVSANNAKKMAQRLRETIERSLGALLVSRQVRTNPGSCPELSVMLDGWDGQFTVLTRKRIARHIESVHRLRRAAPPDGEPGRATRRCADVHPRPGLAARTHVADNPPVAGRPRRDGSGQARCHRGHPCRPQRRRDQAALSPPGAAGGTVRGRADRGDRSRHRLDASAQCAGRPCQCHPNRHPNRATADPGAAHRHAVGNHAAGAAGAGACHDHHPRVHRGATDGSPAGGAAAWSHDDDPRGGPASRGRAVLGHIDGPGIHPADRTTDAGARYDDPARGRCAAKYFEPTTAVDAAAQLGSQAQTAHHLAAAARTR